MSVNTAAFDSKNRPLPLNPLEKFLFETDDIAEFSLVCGNGYPGSTLGYASASGKLFVTDLRIVFRAIPELPIFKSFTCPFIKLSQVSLQSPSIFPFSKKSVLSAKINMIDELDERIITDGLSDLKIKFSSAPTAKSVEALINSQLIPKSSLDISEPLPLYSPPLPSYVEATRGR